MFLRNDCAVGDFDAATFGTRAAIAAIDGN
jgi:hypothetical protein